MIETVEMEIREEEIYPIKYYCKVCSREFLPIDEKKEKWQ